MYVYEVAKIKPLAFYAFDLRKRFFSSLRDLHNVLIQNIVNGQNVFD